MIMYSTYQVAPWLKVCVFCASSCLCRLRRAVAVDCYESPPWAATVGCYVQGAFEWMPAYVAYSSGLVVCLSEGRHSGLLCFALS